MTFVVVLHAVASQRTELYPINKITSKVADAFDFFGASCSISDDYAIVGSFGDGSELSTGSVAIYL